MALTASVVAGAEVVDAAAFRFDDDRVLVAGPLDFLRSALPGCKQEAGERSMEELVRGRTR